MIRVLLAIALFSLGLGIESFAARSDYQKRIEVMKSILPQGVYSGEACSVQVSAEAGYKLTLHLEESESEFNFPKKGQRPQILEFGHDNEARNFVRTVIQENGKKKNLVIIRSRGKPAAIATGKEICVLTE